MCKCTVGWRTVDVGMGTHDQAPVSCDDARAALISRITELEALLSLAEGAVVYDLGGISGAGAGWDSRPDKSIRSIDVPPYLTANGE